MEDLLGRLMKEELERLEGKQMEITEKIYPNLPELVKHTSDICGIPEETLVHSCIGAAWYWQGKGIEWYHILDIVRTVYLTKKRVEAKNNQ
jgi:hypothetical protein